MLRVAQTLFEIEVSLQPLKVEWEDEVAERIIGRLKTFPMKSYTSYTEADIQAIIENNKPLVQLTSRDFDDGMLIIRTFLGLSGDQFLSALNEIIGEGGTGLQRYEKDSAGFLIALTDLGLLDATVTHICTRTPHWTDVLIERLRSGRGSAISGQKRGRVAEDFVETIIKQVFGEGGYEARAAFTGRNGATAKFDFAIPNRFNPRIVVEAKGFGATGSKMSDVIGDLRAIIAAKRSDTAFLFFTDGLTWKRRQSDLKKIIEHQNQGDITRIHTQSMAGQFHADLRTLKDEHGL